MAEEMKKTGEVQDTATGGEKETKTITVEDILKNKDFMAQILESDAVKAVIQSETDKVRTKASKEKESTMSEFERYKAEMDKQIAEMKKFQSDHMKTKVLKKCGLDLKLWDFVHGENEEEILKQAETLKNTVQKIAESKIGAKVNTGGKDFTGMTKEQFGKMTYTEKAELYQTDRELYEKLSK